MEGAVCSAPHDVDDADTPRETRSCHRVPKPEMGWARDLRESMSNSQIQIQIFHSSTTRGSERRAAPGSTNSEKGAYRVQWTQPGGGEEAQIPARQDLHVLSFTRRQHALGRVRSVRRHKSSARRDLRVAARQEDLVHA
eukprot:CAMPEP_0174866390 /NCGR_PEP_ID=MMETSP1114-20130205/62013_1 /TAXON_ID=312471 /ORGANISM="Neobodo designis, Strain CCAP 1951/1" /LENGTH=138 /DNA_ID=CAMNT_0016101551 /DNA_START=69 /DNA_END=482 /DNA_ORIENTATION=+